MRRVFPLAVIFLMMTSTLPILMITASGSTTTLSSFSASMATIEIDLSGGMTNNSATIDIPRNVTFITASFDVEIASTDDSPGSVWLDIDQDGDHEWSFTETGYGSIGHQNQFWNGADYSAYSVSGGTVQAPGFFLPPSVNLQSSSVNLSFTPDVGSGFFAVGALEDIVESDFDGDGLSEIVMLSNDSSITNLTTAVSWIDYDPSTGLSLSSWQTTCDNASALTIGDINNDSWDDVMSIAPSNDMVCIHLWNSTASSFDSKMNISLSQGLNSAVLSDTNRDGFDDIVSIHPNGDLSLRVWVNSTSSFSANSTQTIVPYGQIGMPADLASLYSSDFASPGYPLILLKEQNGAWQTLNYTGGAWSASSAFSNITKNEILSDLDGDGDIDVVGSNEQGYAIMINNAGVFNESSYQTIVEMSLGSVCDYDGDGALEFLASETGISDGSNQTVEGNITSRSINATSLGALNPELLEPWSLPKAVICADLDGDGLAEQMVESGESSDGLFIGAWHTISLDVDGDGTSEAARAGYSGNGVNGLDPLVLTDETNSIKADISPILINLPALPDDYGTSMANISMNSSSIGAGTFNLSDLDIGYDGSFRVDLNPYATANLTNIINQKMTGGTGTFTFDLPFNSSEAGVITITNLNAIHTPGAPQVTMPATPILVLGNVTAMEVNLAWNDLIDFGEDLQEFEIFRSQSANATLDLTSPYQTDMINFTIDTNVTVGMTYYYSMRSVHRFGITSNLSNTVEAFIPYPSPPGRLASFSISDVANDSGGAINVSWIASIDNFDHYEVFVETQPFTSTNGLSAASTVSSTSVSAIISGLENGVAHHAAVIAVDQYGNFTSDVISTGPAYPRIDIPASTSLTLEVSETIEIGQRFDLNISMLVDSVESTPNGTITIQLITSNETILISTDWNGVHFDDFDSLGLFATNVTGAISFSANYSGFAGDELNQPVAAAATVTNRIVTVQATLSSAADYYELDWDNETDVRVGLVADFASQTHLVEDATFDWVATNDNTTLTGSDSFENGFSQFLVNIPEGGKLYVNMTGPAWLVVNPAGLVIQLVPYGETVEENETQGNQTNDTTWTPTSLLDILVDCPTIVVDASLGDQTTVCTFSNPNNFSIDVVLENSDWSVWEADTIGFYPAAGQSEFTLVENESKNITIDIDLIQDPAAIGLNGDKMTVKGSFTATDYVTSHKFISHQVDWQLEAEDISDNPDEPDDGENDGKTNDKTQGQGDNSLLYIGGAVGVATIALLVFIVVRMKNDESDWNEEDLDFDEDPSSQAEQISKPLPVGLALDEIEDRDYDDHVPDGPDKEFIDRLNNDEEFYQEEPQEQTQDDGITVDEHGTEWYEDEVGVWWYKDEGEEDWSEFTE
ncbi:MAG: FG-GAP-like repeat-containing protein [Candidatus Poseidoniales archaeon]